MAEIAYETLRAAIEVTRGTAITTPTHMLNLEGTLTPKLSLYRPREQRGTTFTNYRSVATRKVAEWEGEGDADVNTLPFLLQMAVVPNTTPSTPTDAVAARLWEFVRSGTADNIKSATIWWGDPALDQLRSAFGMLDELVVENDASSEEVATVNAKGMALFPTKVAAPAATASIAGATLPGGLMQLWIDTGTDAIGTTEIADRLISAKHTIKTGVKYKYIAKGPAASLGFSLVGREKIASTTTEITLEFLDFTEYDEWAASTALKVRVRHNGSLIETQASTDFYNYVEFDAYGAGTDLEWGDNEGTNRTITIVIESQYDSTLGSDTRVAVQNARATL